MKLPLAIAIAIAAAGALGSSALAAAPSAPASASAAARPDVVFEGVRLWVFRGSQLRSVGSAASVTYDRASAVGRAVRPEADFLEASGSARPVHVVAGSAEGHVVGRTLDGRDGVELQREDGTASTRSAHYDGLTHLATGSDPTTVKTARFQVAGQGGFSLDTVSKQLELNGPVAARGEVQP